MTDPHSFDQSSLPANITIHGGSVTFNIYQARGSGETDEGGSPAAVLRPTISSAVPDCNGNMISPTGGGSGLTFKKIWAKVVCASDTGTHENPWNNGDPPTEGRLTGPNNTTWAFDNGLLTFPMTCNGNYRLHIWGIYQGQDIIRKADVFDFTCNSGSGSGVAMILGTGAGAAIKGAARLFRLRAEFPAGDPTAAGLPEGVDFGTPANPPLLRFDETAGWILPTWNQVHPEAGPGRWQLRLFDRGSHHRGELSWQDTRVGVRTLGVWVAQPCSCLKTTRFTVQDATASVNQLPALWLEPA